MAIELEKRYLAKYLPDDLENCECIEIIDVYIPKSAVHATLRLRKNGEKYVIERKIPATLGSTEKYVETAIELSSEEFAALRNVKGRVLHKMRYFYPWQGHMLEIGVFQGALAGLVIVEAEFSSEEMMAQFVMPEFCLAEVGNSKYRGYFAGGVLCGKAYEELLSVLDELGYVKITGENNGDK